TRTSCPRSPGYQRKSVVEARLLWLPLRRSAKSVVHLLPELFMPDLEKPAAVLEPVSRDCTLPAFVFAAIASSAPQTSPPHLQTQLHMSEKIAFVGVGRMGANMARRLKDCGYAVTAVYDVHAPSAA